MVYMHQATKCIKMHRVLIRAAFHSSRIQRPPFSSRQIRARILVIPVLNRVDIRPRLNPVDSDGIRPEDGKIDVDELDEVGLLGIQRAHGLQRGPARAVVRALEGRHVLLLRARSAQTAQHGQSSSQWVPIVEPAASSPQPAVP
jgi:hypothetical protein